VHSNREENFMQARANICIKVLGVEKGACFLFFGGRDIKPESLSIENREKGGRRKI